jgi:hypothetical protein
MRTIRYVIASRSLAVAFLTTAALSLALTLWRVSRHYTGFGRIHHSAITHDYKSSLSPAAKVAIWVDQHSPLWLNLCRHVNCVPREPIWTNPLLLGTNLLCWSLNNPTKKTGWLSFCLLHPFSTNAVWEFAPCSRHKLRDVRLEDLNSTFVGIKDPLGSTVFGTNWHLKPSGLGRGRLFWLVG